jgi:hypothetical protein
MSHSHTAACVKNVVLRHNLVEGSHSYPITIPGGQASGVCGFATANAFNLTEHLKRAARARSIQRRIAASRPASFPGVQMRLPGEETKAQTHLKHFLKKPEGANTKPFSNLHYPH